MGDEKICSYCSLCNVQVELIEEGDYTQSNIIGGSETNPVDAIYNVDIYTLLRCPNCHSPFLYFTQQIEGAMEDMLPERSEPKQVYPEIAIIDLKDVPESIEKAFLEAYKAHKTGLYLSSVFMCRKTIEEICREKNIKNGNLKNKLFKLKEIGIISDNIYEWADNLRLIGNEAAHDLLPDINKKDSQDIIDFTEAIVLTIFTLSSKFESFKKRRNKESNES